MRKQTRVVKVGNVLIGGDNPISIQSMTNTSSKDITATANQINELTKCGCDIARIAILDMEDALSVKEIKSKISIPLVCDIHFDYRLALVCIENGCDKLRINPGNIGSIENTKKVVDKCKEYGIPIRIGVNAGSLEKEYKELYGVSAKAMVESAKNHIKILEDLNFYDIVVSLKASSIDMCLEAYKLASESFDYPLHIGITEAGTLLSGTIKSTIGLTELIKSGIGDTLRVSLSTDPIYEVRVAKEILAALNLYKKPNLISCPTCGRCQYNMFNIVNEIESFLDCISAPITVAIMGCAVNGPGEASHADIGIAGGKNEALLFKNGQIIRKIKEKNIISEFKEEILKTIKEKKL